MEKGGGATVRYTTIESEVVAEKRGGTRRLLVPDPLGPVVALVDNSQAKTDTFGYWPYGEEASRTGSTPTPFRYVGKLGYYRDSANRSYVRARVLRPDLGSWLMADPIGLGGGVVNLFQYADDNPTTMLDPDGLFSCWWCRILGLEHPCGQSFCWSHCEDGRHCQRPPRNPPGRGPGLGEPGYGPFIPCIAVEDYHPCVAACESACAGKLGFSSRLCKSSCIAVCSRMRTFTCGALWKACGELAELGREKAADACLLYHNKFCSGAPDFMIPGDPRPV